MKIRNVFGNLEKAGQRLSPLAVTAMVLLLGTTPLLAGPWDKPAEVLEKTFTGPIAKSLSLVAVVVGGLMYAFGEGDSKRMLAGIIFGLGMALGATQFVSWLFF